jgi:DNA polymerase V
MLMDPQPVATEQFGLLLDTDEPANRPALMTTLDKVNTRWGRSTVKLASCGTDGRSRSWKMKQERKTPGYTTQWLELINAN